LGNSQTSADSAQGEGTTVKGLGAYQNDNSR